MLASSSLASRRRLAPQLQQVTTGSGYKTAKTPPASLARNIAAKEYKAVVKTTLLSEDVRHPFGHAQITKCHAAMQDWKGYMGK